MILVTPLDMSACQFPTDQVPITGTSGRQLYRLIKHTSAGPVIRFNLASLPQWCSDHFHVSRKIISNINFVSSGILEER